MGQARMLKGQSGRARFESYSPAHPSPAGSSGGAERRGAELLSSRRAADTMNAAKNAVHEAGLAHASRGGARLAVATHAGNAYGCSAAIGSASSMRCRNPAADMHCRDDVEKQGSRQGPNNAK